MSLLRHLRHQLVKMGLAPASGEPTSECLLHHIFPKPVELLAYGVSALHALFKHLRLIRKSCLDANRRNGHLHATDLDMI